ncbi:MAG: hypothetical protein JWO58_275, partial [Chitinophagaceae bacterium]|nr:hypothetical protein [Chitinophagaceae bacterium]
MKKLLVICPNPEHVAPAQRLKYEQYFGYFRANGIEVTVSPFMSNRFQHIVYKKGHYIEKVYWTFFGYLKRIYDLFRLPFYDGIYIFLWVTPFGFPLFESLFVRMNKRMVYDIDDLVFLAPPSKANSLIAPLKGKKKMAFLMKKAKHVITCTPFLDEYVRQFTSHTTDISSTINTETYLPVNSYSNESPLIIGWSGSHSTSAYLTLLETPLRKLKAKYNFNILVIGDSSFHFQDLSCTAIAWNETTEVSELQKIDIGLYPLPNEEWVLGKSGLKALQYMALGIPTVATAIGANFRVIEDGISGMLVNTE